MGREKTLEEHERECEKAKRELEIFLVVWPFLMLWLVFIGWVFGWI